MMNGEAGLEKLGSSGRRTQIVKQRPAVAGRETGPIVVVRPVPAVPGEHSRAAGLISTEFWRILGATGVPPVP